MQAKRPRVDKTRLMLCQPNGSINGQIYYLQGWGKASQLVKGPVVKNARCSIPHLAVDDSTGDEVDEVKELPLTLDLDVQDEFIDSSAVSFALGIPEVDFTGAIWRSVGPADYRRYQILEESASHSLTSLIQHLIGDKFKARLSEFTQLSLGNCVSFEVRQCGPGDYQMLNDSYPEPAGLDVILMHAEVESSDSWHYLVEGETQFTMPIKPGWWMAIVYRTEQVRRFQRRLTSKCHQILLTFAVVE